jgi:hypothetical protein
MKALNRGHVREFTESEKKHHWGGESLGGTNDPSREIKTRLPSISKAPIPLWERLNVR